MLDPILRAEILEFSTCKNRTIVTHNISGNPCVANKERKWSIVKTIFQGRILHSQCVVEPNINQAIPRNVGALVVEHGVSVGIGYMI